LLLKKLARLKEKIRIEKEKKTKERNNMLGNAKTNTNIGSNNNIYNSLRTELGGLSSGSSLSPSSPSSSLSLSKNDDELLNSCLYTPDLMVRRTASRNGKRGKEEKKMENGKSNINNILNNNNDDDDDDDEMLGDLDLKTILAVDEDEIYQTDLIRYSRSSYLFGGGIKDVKKKEDKRKNIR
jgi:hypothetical protein